MSGSPEHPPIGPAPRPVVAVVLAAGGGSRFLAGGLGAHPTPPAAHKLLADLAGQPVIAHVLGHVGEAAIGPVVVVTGAVEVPLPPDTIEVHNPGWATGQASSLACGLRRAAELGADAAVIGLGDQPWVVAEAWRRVATAPAAWPIVVASYDGRRGPNPVRLLRSLWAEVPTTGDEGARPLMRRRADLVHDVACPGSAHDIDTLEDLQRWTSS